MTFVHGTELGHLRSIEHRLGRRLERIHLREFDYAGDAAGEGPGEEARTDGPEGGGSRLTEEADPRAVGPILGHE